MFWSSDAPYGAKRDKSIKAGQRQPDALPCLPVMKPKLAAIASFMPHGHTAPGLKAQE
jgi:hypothetical protein